MGDDLRIIRNNKVVNDRVVRDIPDDYRVMDPGRGAFCAVTKSGHALPFPPTKREPLVDREKNPRGVRHLGKTAQDHQPVSERARVKAANKRREAMQ